MKLILFSFLSLLSCVCYVNSATFTPIFYDILLDFSKLNKSRIFSGFTSIYFNVTKDTYGRQEILLDSELLNISYVSVIDSNTGFNISVVKHDYKDKKYSVLIRLDDQLSEITVTIGYTGQIGYPGDDGVYMTNDTRIVATNSYPLGIRRIIPCINDPLIRTSFKLNVKLIDKSWGIHTFYNGLTSPYLPVHAIGFIMTHHYRKVDDISNDKFYVWVPSFDEPLYDSVNSNKFLKDILSKGTYFYDFFEDDSILDKIHIVMVPGIRLLSLVNHRLISMRPDVMISSDKETAEEAKATAVATVNALAKHFFRCVVSPASWEDFWLADSLALYLQYALLNNQIFPGTNFPDLFTLEVQRPAMRGSQIEVNPKSVDPSILNTSQIYPPVYQGAAVLKMLEPLSSQEEITKDLFNYYKYYEYQNVNTQTFLDFMSGGSFKKQLNLYGKRLNPVLDKWIHTIGYPLLSVNLNSNGFTISQEIFGKEGSSSQWIVPFSYIDSADYNGTLKWISGQKSASFQDSNVKTWVQINKQSKGLFRVNYGDIIKVLSNDDIYWSFSGVERAVILDDIYKLSWTEQSNFGGVLSLFQKLATENDYTSYKTSFDIIHNLGHMTFQKGLGDKYSSKIADIISGLYSKVDWSKQKSLNISEALWIRAVVESACDYSVSQCQSTAVNIDKNKVLNDLLPTVMCYEINKADQSKWKEYFNKFYNKTDSQYARADVLYSLACVPNSGSNGSLAINTYLDTINSDDILEEDAMRAFSYIYSRPEHMNQTVNYIYKNYTLLFNRFKENFLASLISDISTHLLSDYYYDIFNSIKNYTRKNSEIYNSITKAQQDMVQRTYFINSNEYQISNWLNTNSSTYKPLPPPTTTTPSNGPTQPHKSSATCLTFNVFAVWVLALVLQFLINN